MAIKSSGQTKIASLTTALINKFTALISAHNSDLNAHPNLSCSTHTHGNLANNGTIGNDSGKIITTTTDGAIQASDSIPNSAVTDTNANNYSNIGTMSSGATQQTINANINTAIGSLQSEISGLEQDLLS